MDLILELWAYVHVSKGIVALVERPLASLVADPHKVEDHISGL